MAELKSLSWDEQDLYWRAITVIEAQAALVEMEIAAYPNLKEASRDKIFQRYHRLAYPKTYDNAVPLSTGEALKRLNEVLNV